MDGLNLYEKVRHCLAHIIVTENDEPISEGTGFSFTSDGALLTAAHVVAGGFPIRGGEVDQLSRKIICAFVIQQKTILYKPAICPIQVQIGGEVLPLQLDVAILVPVTKIGEPLQFLTASVVPPHIGEEMIFAGYSDEVEFPFNVDRLVPQHIAGMDDLNRNRDLGIKAKMAGPMIKRGHVGNSVAFQATLDGNTAISATSFYLDNQIHDGASGGPIVALDGTVKGVITKRMVTTIAGRDQGDMTVPSGSTLGLSLEPLLALMTRPPTA